MRVETEFYEVVGLDGRRTGRYATIEDARANRGAGQIRRRVDFTDVAAAYSVRAGGVEVARFDRAAEAAQASKSYVGATVHMIPSSDPVPQVV